MNKPLLIPLVMLLGLGNGCALRGPSQIGLYPCSGYYDHEPIEEGEDLESWAVPHLLFPKRNLLEEPKFDEDQARAVLLPALFRSAALGSASVSNSLFAGLGVQAFAEVPLMLANCSAATPYQVAVTASTVKHSVKYSDTFASESEDESYSLVLVYEDLLLASHHLGECDEGGSGPFIYSITLIRSKFEPNPLVLLFRNEGGSSRCFAYELYRIERNDLRLLWKWDGDGYSHSAEMGYAFSNLDFSGLVTGKRNEIRIYSTEGMLRLFMEGETEKDLIPHYKRSTFSWSVSEQRFVMRSTRSVRPLVAKRASDSDP